MAAWWLRLCQLRRSGRRRRHHPLPATPAPLPAHKQFLDSEHDEDCTPRSPACTAYTTFGLQDTGYVDREQLQHALSTLFAAEYGSLDFGIHTRNDRWCFYAPAEVDATQIRSVLGWQ